jgi:hypothetical protein
MAQRKIQQSQLDPSISLGSASNWGDLGGTLSDQIDLQAALNAKADDTDLHTHTNKTVLDATTASFTTADETKLDGVAAGATANSTDAALKARANHTGTQSADTITDGTTNKAYTAAEKTKLAGVATGATANTGNVVGPGSSTDSTMAIFDGTTGKLLKTSGVIYGAAFGTLTVPWSLIVDAINERTTNAGVTISNVLLKDNGVIADDGIFTNYITINGSQVLTKQDADNDWTKSYRGTNQTSTISGTWGYATGSGWRTASWNQSTGTAVNDEVQFKFHLDAGTYNFQTISRTGTDFGIATIALNGTTIGTMDCYDTVNAHITNSSGSVVVSSGGLATYSFKVTGRNASNTTGYKGAIFLINVYRIT